MHSSSNLNPIDSPFLILYASENCLVVAPAAGVLLWSVSLVVLLTVAFQLRKDINSKPIGICKHNMDILEQVYNTFDSSEEHQVWILTCHIHLPNFPGINRTAINTGNMLILLE